VITVQGQQYIEPGSGGTSLACPIFSAFWAIANQKAGKPLGQAAPLIASLPYGSVQDVLPISVSQANNVHGSVTDSTGTTTYTATELFSPELYGNKTFISALAKGETLNAEDVAAIGFGIDSSLTAGKGWDNATGFGMPYGMQFLNAVAP
jgi:subtilase family serine protease